MALVLAPLSKAQDMETQLYADLVAAGTYFETPPTDSKWGNTNTNKSTHAKFGRYDGTTYIKLISYKMELDVVLEYEVELKKGKLQMVVVNEKDEVLWSSSFVQSGKGSMTVVLEPFEEYRVKFIGKGAKGSYKCNWKAL